MRDRHGRLAGGRDAVDAGGFQTGVGHCLERGVGMQQGLRDLEDGAEPARSPGRPDSFIKSPLNPRLENMMHCRDHVLMGRPFFILPTLLNFFQRKPTRLELVISTLTYVEVRALPIDRKDINEVIMAERLAVRVFRISFELYLERRRHYTSTSVLIANFFDRRKALKVLSWKI